MTSSSTTTSVEEGPERFVQAAPLPVVAVELGSEQVLAASASAQQIFGSERVIVGRTVQEFVADERSGGLDMLASGRLTAYETTRVMRRQDGSLHPLRLWVRAWESRPPVHRAVILMSELGEPPPPVAAERPACVMVIGSANPHLVVDRVSDEITALTGRALEDVLSKPLLSLVEDADGPALLVALAQVATTSLGASVVVRLRGAGTRRGPVVECVLVPVQPAPSVAFALTPLDQRQPGREHLPELTLLDRFRQVVAGAEASRQVELTCASPDLSRLSHREQEIVTRLVRGDRVPAIAAQMYLSQSTVRTHLSAVFRKLGVHSQQELIVRLRAEDRQNVQQLGTVRPPSTTIVRQHLRE